MKSPMRGRPETSGGGANMKSPLGGSGRGMERDPKNRDSTRLPNGRSGASGGGGTGGSGGSGGSRDKGAWA